MMSLARVWTRSAPEIGLGSPGIQRCATGDENGDVPREPDAGQVLRALRKLVNSAAW